MLPRRLQQVHRSKRVHFKIYQRDVARFVMRRLCGAVNNQIQVVRAKKVLESAAIPDIEVNVGEALG